MTGKLLNAGLVALAALVLLVAMAWVFRVGPFKPAPSPAAKVQAQTSAAVADATEAQSKAVDAATTTAQGTITDTTKRTEHAVSEVRRVQQARPAPPPYPDDGFYRGVCATRIYAGNPECRGYGGKP